MNNYCLVLWTCKNTEEAKKVSSLLLNEKLVACVNIFPNIQSMFYWEGKVNIENEVQVFFKTKSHHFEKMKDCILANCTYTVPEILQIPIENGNFSYLSWIDSCVK